MDEASGTRYDSVGPYDLNSPTGTNPFSATGKINKALQMGSTRTVGGNIGNANRDFTVAGWFNISSLADADLIGGVADEANNYTWALRYDRILNRFVFKIFTNGATVTVAANVLGVPSTGTWYFIAGSYDTTTKKISISVNNGVATTATIVGIPKNGIGVLVGGVGDGDRIDEFGIWAKVLSSTELATLYNAGAGETPPFSGTLDDADEPFIECDPLNTSITLHPRFVQNDALTPLAPWGNTIKTLSIDNNDAQAVSNGTAPLSTHTLQFRNFKETNVTENKTPYGTSKIIINLHIMGGINSQDSTMRIVYPARTSENMAQGTSMTRTKIIQYLGDPTMSESEALAIAADNNLFGLDFNAKLNTPTSTARIDGVTMTLCVPYHVNCFNNPVCLASPSGNQGSGSGDDGFGYGTGTL
jgi:hypothetical protein